MRASRTTKRWSASFVKIRISRRNICAQRWRDTDEPRVLLIALRRVAEARGGIAKVAKAAGVERESLYRALSPNGNPRLSTLAAVAKAMGLKLTVEAA